ncbi:hypothetical protein FHS57_001637 [Runella defluvii]|uniref:Uncharacterized protein n=1 Tax=Runella defluvii TaxID=370973 RepID=A0A7W5ZJ90_9BACT|nr:hypothetical protein [Runella defluvii]MBB3837640.1 hypothetical protein [Runella defluvii]
MKTVENKKQVNSELTAMREEINKRLDEVLKKLETRKESNESLEKLQPSHVCKKMGWSRSKFEQFKRDGLFRTTKIGGKVYVYASDLQRLFPKDFF